MCKKCAKMASSQHHPLCSQSRLHLDEHLSLFDQITALSKSCSFHIRQLHCIRPFLDIKTAITIATSIVHSKLDYCNSLYYNLPNSQLSRLQHIQNYLARAVVKAPKFSHITPIVKSLHWLKVNERIEYKILSLTYKTLSTAHPAYLHNLISVQPRGRTRSSSPSLVHPHLPLKITDRSFRYASPSLWNNLPASFRQPRSSSVTNITPSIISSLFHSRLKTHLFHKSLPL